MNVLKTWSLVFAVFLALVFLAARYTPPSRPSADSFDAYLMAQTFIKQRLLSPSTAKFCSFEDSTVHAESEDTFEVTGCVDSQNVYAATVRNRFHCRVKFIGNNHWQLVGIPGLSTN